MWTRLNGPGYTDNQYEGPPGEIYYPDGRKMTLAWYDENHWVIAGAVTEPMDQLQHMGNGNYDLVMKDGGRVRFEAGPTVTGYTEYSPAAIIDPYGQTTLLHRDSLGRLDRITEPAGRYLEITYDRFYGLDPRAWTDLPIHVDAYDGLGHFMDRVVYHYDPQYAQGIMAVRYWHLTHVDYADGGQASYTYKDAGQWNNSPWSLVPGLIETCQDDRFAGAMKYIKYEYVDVSPSVPQHAWGQIKAERNFEGHAVSLVEYPSYFSYGFDPGWRTEHRPDGMTRTFWYAGAEIWEFSDFLGRWSSINYGAASVPSHYSQTFTDARQKVTVTEKHRNTGAVMKISPPGGYSTRYTYTDPSNPFYLDTKTVEREDGAFTTGYIRDANNRILHITYPDQSTEHFTYNAFGQILTHTLVSGGVENFRYDLRGRKTLSWPPVTDGDANPELHPTRYYYYSDWPNTDRLQYVVDPRGNATWYDYDLGGRVTKVTHQDTTYTQSEYNFDGTLAWSADEKHPGAATDPNQRTRYHYDEFQRVLTVTNPMNQVTEYAYAITQGDISWEHPYWHTTSNLKFIKSPMQKNVVFDYDANYRKTSETKAAFDPHQSITLFEYDEVGNLSKRTEVASPNWKITTFGYDDRNRQTSVTNALNETTRIEYDAANNKTKEIRHNNHSFRSWKYDSMNQLTEAHDWRTNNTPAANQTTYYWHNPTNTTRTITDTKGAVYTFQYDAMHRKTAVTYPADAGLTTRSEYFYYDIGGNLSLYRNPAGQYKHLNFADSYDNRNRLRHSAWTASRYSMVVDWNIGQEVVINYDEASRMTSIITNNGATTVGFGYDDANRKIWEDQTLAGYPKRRVNTPRDADGNRDWLGVPDWYFIDYNYTPRNQLASIATFADFTYDTSGNITKRLGTWMYQHATNFAYDQLNRVSQVEQANNFSVFARSHFQYDTVGREEATWRDEDGGRGERFDYDPTNQVTKVFYEALNVSATNNPTGALKTQEYIYTPDRLNRAAMNENGVATTYAMTNGMNQYTGMGGQSITYDSRFNISGYDGKTYTYDAQNRPVGGSLQCVYDGLGRCVKRTVSGETRLFTYDEWKPILEWGPSGNFLAWNIYGAGPDEILARNDVTRGPLIYKQDHRGNVVALLDAGGTILEKYKYDAFGKPTILSATNTQLSTSAVGNRFLFTGREWIAELGIYDYRHRLYHPGLGRFLQGDPLGLQTEGEKLSADQAAYFWAGGAPATFGATEMNLYRYCGNDPINNSDPTGLETLTRPEVDGEIGDRVVQAAQFIGHQVAEMYREDPVGFIILVATMGRAPKAGGARLPTIKSEYVPRTFEGARVPNRITDVSRSTFEKNLSNSGWNKSVSKDGKVTNYEKDGAKYSVRDNAKSTGGPTADYYKAGSDKPDLKIRLKKD